MKDFHDWQFGYDLLYEENLSRWICTKCGARVFTKDIIINPPPLDQEITWGTGLGPLSCHEFIAIQVMES